MYIILKGGSHFATILVRDRLGARFRDRTSNEAMELEVQWHRSRFVPMLRPLVLALADSLRIVSECYSLLTGLCLNCRLRLK